MAQKFLIKLFSYCIILPEAFFTDLISRAFVHGFSFAEYMAGPQNGENLHFLSGR